MQPAQLSRYMKDPALMGPEAVQALNALVEQFPYFQPAHMLLSIAARRWDAATYQRTLKKTAIVVPDRARLFELVMQAEQWEKESTKATPEASRESELTLLKVAEQVSENLELPAAQPVDSEIPQPAGAGEALTGQVEKEIGRQVVAARIEKEILSAPGGAGTAAQTAPPPATFGDWLSYLKKNNGQPYAEIERQVQLQKEKRQSSSPEPDQVGQRRDKNRAIIDSVIEKNPGHIRVKDERFFTPENKAKESLLDNEHLVTETLARIYALQGNTAKAIRAYQILSLKNPRKSAYFAGLIERLRNNEKPE